jgi:hypothetical protein
MPAKKSPVLRISDWICLHFDTAGLAVCLLGPKRFRHRRLLGPGLS